MRLTYIDNGDVKASVSWIDHRGKRGTMDGSPYNSHMHAMLVRARREGVKVRHEQMGWLP